MIYTFSRMVLLVTGLYCFYIAVFQREDRQGKLQDRVEALWVGVNDRAKITGKRTAAIFNRVAAIVLAAFNRFYGPSLISAQIVGVSSASSLSGLFLAAGLGITFLLHLLRSLPGQPANLPANIGFVFLFASAVCSAIGVVFFTFAALPSLFPSRLARVISLVPLLSLTFGVTKLARRHVVTHEQIIILICLLVATLSDIAMLAVVRVSVRKISESVLPFRIFCGILAQLVVVGLLVVGPFELAGPLLVRYGQQPFPQGLLMIAIFNLSTAVAASAFVLALLFVLLHRIFWPVLDVITHPIARYAVVRNHKAMAGLSAACFIYAFPNMRGFIAGFFAWIVTVLSG